MKAIILIILMAFTTISYAQRQPEGVTYTANILRIIDGDTVVIEAKFLPPPLKKELLVRIYGIDTPEKGFRAKCPQEDQHGQAASLFTRHAISNAKKRQVVIYDWDKYGGRILGDILLNGKSLRNMLIENGFAREYYGEAKQSWCN